MNSWERAKTVAKDRDKWRQCIGALFATGVKKIDEDGYTNIDLKHLSQK